MPWAVLLSWRGLHHLPNSYPWSGEVGPSPFQLETAALELPAFFSRKQLGLVLHIREKVAPRFPVVWAAVAAVVVGRLYAAEAERMTEALAAGGPFAPVVERVEVAAVLPFAPVEEEAPLWAVEAVEMLWVAEAEPPLEAVELLWVAEAVELLWVAEAVEMLWVAEAVSALAVSLPVERNHRDSPHHFPQPRRRSHFQRNHPFRAL